MLHKAPAVELSVGQVLWVGSSHSASGMVANGERFSLIGSSSNVASKFAGCCKAAVDPDNNELDMIELDMIGLDMIGFVSGAIVIGADEGEIEFRARGIKFSEVTKGVGKGGVDGVAIRPEFKL
jgi:hypothetical protein